MKNVKFDPLGVFKTGRYFEAIIFDLYGTLVEIYRWKEYLAIIDQISRILNVDPVKFRTAWDQSGRKYKYGDYPSVLHRFHESLEIYNGGTKYEIPNARIQQACQIRLDYIKQQQLRIKPGVMEALTQLKKNGYKLGLISNCTIETAMLWQSNPLKFLFSESIFSCNVRLNKPDPAIFQMAVQKIGVSKPEHCIYVADGDDHEFDGALSLHMKPILTKYDIPDMFRHAPFPDISPAIYDYAQLVPTIEEFEYKFAANKN